MRDMEITIRPVETLDEYRDCEELQRRAWGFASDLDVIPVTALLTTREHGGVVLGAFDGEGAMAGFCFGFLGRDDRRRLVLCSHMLAVDPDRRNAGIGEALKWAQRRHALAAGVDLIVWTYDPLESLNGCFNFGKLGVVADRYHVNLYGETTSELHRGTATDRLTARWYLRSRRVIGRLRGRVGRWAKELESGRIEAPWALRCDDPGAPVPAPSEPRLDLQEDPVLCEIPRAIQEIKSREPEAAVGWREATRAVLRGYLAAGYFVRECVRTRGEPRRTVYLLQRGSPEPAGLEE